MLHLLVQAEHSLPIGPPGTLKLVGETLLIQCKDRPIACTALQVEGRRSVSAVAFANGFLKDKVERKLGAEGMKKA
jgi:methionyl-tRNA formyltransferase